MRQEGFTLTELLVSTTIMLIVLAGAMTTFKNALDINEAASLVADSNQNLRAAINLMVRDLMQAGRGIPIGGVPIPSGAGTTAINRPGPSGTAYTFDNLNFTTLPAIVAGPGMGPTIGSQTTDIITVLMTDPTLPALTLNPSPAVAGQATLAGGGSSVDVGAATTWISDPATGVRAGDLIMFSNALGNAMQTVTSAESPVVSFAANDWFNLNQPAATQGSISQIVTAPIPQTTVQRVLMVTYYVDNVTMPGRPRLARRINYAAGQALAGVVEDLDLTFDLVDGVINPVAQHVVPFALNGVVYTPNQIRKVNLHLGVRSETVSSQRRDYLRTHLNTVVSVRSLAYISRYQ